MSEHLKIGNHHQPILNKKADISIDIFLVCLNVFFFGVFEETTSTNDHRIME